jgi:hypothetical protein
MNSPMDVIGLLTSPDATLICGHEFGIIHKVVVMTGKKGVLIIYVGGE